MRKITTVLFLLIAILTVESLFLVYLNRKNHKVQLKLDSRSVLSPSPSLISDIDLKGALVVLDNFTYEKSTINNIDDVDYVLGKVRYVNTTEDFYSKRLNIKENEEIIFFAYRMYPNDPLYYIQATIYYDKNCSGVFKEDNYDEKDKKITFDTFKSKILDKKVRIKIIRPKYKEINDLSKLGLSVRNKLNQLVGWKIAVCD